MKPGLNRASYVCSQLEEKIYFNVFLYSEEDKIVITDIDGTITESDLMGHVAQFLGITNHQEGVVELLDRVVKRGYRVVYLTARSMAQEEDTKRYLFESLQETGDRGRWSLPEGPVLFSPVTFFSGLISEVVTGSPHLQKSQV